MPGPCITVFGGSGFLGRAIVDRLAGHGIAGGGATLRIAVRRPERATDLLARYRPGQVEVLRGDVREAEAVAQAVAGASAVVNAVGLYVEQGAATFEAVHIRGAQQVARQAARLGVPRLVHVSGIGAAEDSPSHYVRARARGDAAVRSAFPEATVLRPSVLFGPGDAFFTSLAAIARAMPVIPLFGGGDTRLQPVYVGDVAQAVAAAVERPAAAGRTFDLGGPDIYSYRDLLVLTLRQIGRRRLLLPVPFAIWDLLAAVAGLLPRPPLTRAQVVLMKSDNVAGDATPGLSDLGIDATAVETLLPRILPAPTHPAGGL